MALVFDTAELAPGDRAEATCAAMQENTVPSTVMLHDPSAIVSRMSIWNYGDARIFRTEMSGFQLARTEKQIRSGPGELLALAIHEQCFGMQEQYGVQQLVRPNQLMIMDLNSPYTYELAGPGASFCLHVPIRELALPPDVVRGAAAKLSASPAYGLVAGHITELARNAERLAAGTAADQLGQTSIDLTRALIASAYDPDYVRGMMTEMLMPRIRGYIRQHLSDPTLSADSIARVHDISVRKLFRLCEEADFSLEQWIITRRLEGSRDELARPETVDVSVAIIGRRWGFTNPSYFARRFKAEYGLSPREWREASQ